MFQRPQAVVTGPDPPSPSSGLGLDPDAIVRYRPTITVSVEALSLIEVVHICFNFKFGTYATLRQSVVYELLGFHTISQTMPGRAREGKRVSQ